MDKSALTKILYASLSLAIAASAAQALGQNQEICAPGATSDVKIKVGKANCSTSKHGCDGLNPPDEAEAWITVPTSTCAKIIAKEWSALPKDVCERIEGCTKTDTAAAVAY